MSLFDLASCGYLSRPSYYLGSGSYFPLSNSSSLYEGLLRLATPKKPQPKTWRAVVDVLGYSEEDVTVTREGRNFVVKGIHESATSVEGDYDRREMKQTVAVPENVPVDDCTLHTAVRDGQLLIELREKTPKPAPVRTVPVEKTDSDGAARAAGGEEEKPEQAVAKSSDLSLLPVFISSSWDSKEGSYEMECSLPGFSKDCVTVNVDERSKTVTVKAEERDDHSMRSFQKTVSLPKDSKAESLKSVFSDDGQLRITAEKLAEVA